METMFRKQITILGHPKQISEDQLNRYIFKSLGIMTKVKNKVNQHFLEQHVKRKELLYHPMWLAKILVIADRKPFPPKKIPKMCFIDAISGYRGLLTTVPSTSKKDEPFRTSFVISPEIKEPDEVKRYIKDVQEKQINRSYILKKPEHQLIEYDLVYLPLWKVQMKSSTLTKDFYINANTGESEEYLAKQWKSKRWLLNR